MNFHPRIFRIWCFGEKRLAEPAFIMGDKVGSSTQNMRGRTIIALKLDDHSARKILVEAQNIVHFGAAPTINGLIVIADAAEINFVFAHASFAMLIGLEIASH